MFYISHTTIRWWQSPNVPNETLVHATVCSNLDGNFAVPWSGRFQFLIKVLASISSRRPAGVIPAPLHTTKDGDSSSLFKQLNSEWGRELHYRDKTTNPAAQSTGIDSHPIRWECCSCCLGWTVFYSESQRTNLILIIFYKWTFQEHFHVETLLKHPVNTRRRDGASAASVKCVNKRGKGCRGPPVIG